MWPMNDWQSSSVMADDISGILAAMET
jgi:hypothetical protein